MDGKKKKKDCHLFIFYKPHFLFFSVATRCDDLAAVKGKICAIIGIIIGCGEVGCGESELGVIAHVIFVFSFRLWHI